VSRGGQIGGDPKHHHCIDPSRLLTYRITFERLGRWLEYDVIYYDSFSREHALECGFVDEKSLVVLLPPHPVDQHRASVKQVVFFKRQVLAECIFVFTISIATLDSPAVTPYFLYLSDCWPWVRYVGLSRNFDVLSIDFRKKTLKALDWNFEML
jgi:hypothetical protein